jgi:excinuclease ABC subunit A
VKLSKELSRRDTGRTLYILDEPTTGLHFADIEHLLVVLHKLRDDGNTIVVIEHNLDVIKTADWVIDLGPDGGHRGGRIIAEGTPEDIAAMPQSHTGRFLAKTLGTEAKPTRPAPSPRAEAPRPPTKAEKLAAKKAEAAAARGKRKSAA